LAADRERELQRSHMQRAILDLRSQQASELARDLLTSHRPQLSANTTAMLSAAASARQRQQQKQQMASPLPLPRRPTSAREHRPSVQWMDESRDWDHWDAYLLQLQTAEEMENVEPLEPTPARPFSADCR